MFEAGIKGITGADVENLRQLTDLPGYDGGAFFSADCSKIVWRTSRPTGKELETYKELLAQKLVKPTRMDLWIANSDGTTHASAVVVRTGP